MHSEFRKLGLALTLACVAGYVDAIGYLKLAHVFVAQMSGNLIGFAAHFGEGLYETGLTRGYVLLPFAAGVLLGALAADSAFVRGRRARYVWLLGIEALLLGIFLLTNGTDNGFVAVGLLAGAMGVQSALLRRALGRSLRAPFVSSLLVETLESLAAMTHRAQRRERSIQAAATGSILLFYTGSALSAGLISAHLGYGALVLPLALLLTVMVRDLVRPFAPPDAAEAV